MDVSVAHAKTMVCDNCNAQPGQPCTQPTDNSRKPVAWVHNARVAAFERQAQQAAELAAKQSREAARKASIGDEGIVL